MGESSLIWIKANVAPRAVANQEKSFNSTINALPVEALVFGVGLISLQQKVYSHIYIIDL
jgi:hypothetical protein